MTSSIIVGYGEFNGYQLSEIPASMVEELAVRYPLRLDVRSRAQYEDLLITVAVHGELNRRKAGGTQDPHLPTLADLAAEIVDRGYKQASKQHHPDGNGNHESQIRLTQARDALRQSCHNLVDENNEEGPATVIPAPTVRKSRARANSRKNPNDDDCPF